MAIYNTIEVSKGHIYKHSPVNKFGRAPIGIQSTRTDIWDRADSTPTQSIWTPPTEARIHTIASDSVNDNTGGTGANSVVVYYLSDWDTKEQSETVTGNLNAGIAMTNSAVIIHRMRVVPQSTSTTTNDGTITATAATDSTITAQINPGEGQTQMAIYAWPSVQDLYIGDFYATINKSAGQAADANFNLLLNPNPDTQLSSFLVKNTRGLQSTGKSGDTWPFDPPLRFDGPGILKVQATASANDTEGSAGFNGVLVG